MASDLYFHTIQDVHRTILAHAVATDAADICLFEKALVLEADWSLGRNPANVIQMTTATPLSHRSAASRTPIPPGGTMVLRVCIPAIRPT